MPGIQSTFLAMDTEEGVEVVWNELLFTDKKAFKAHEVSHPSPAGTVPTSLEPPGWQGSACSVCPLCQPQPTCQATVWGSGFPGASLAGTALRVLCTPKPASL